MTVGRSRWGLAIRAPTNPTPRVGAWPTMGEIWRGDDLALVLEGASGRSRARLPGEPTRAHTALEGKRATYSYDAAYNVPVTDWPCLLRGHTGLAGASP